MVRGLIRRFWRAGRVTTLLLIRVVNMHRISISVSLPEGTAKCSQRVYFSEKKKDGVVVSTFSGTS